MRVSFTILAEGGQFTHKLFEQSSRFPAFLRNLASRTEAKDKALVLDEKSWNAFPYTRTIGTVWKIDFFEIFRIILTAQFLIRNIFWSLKLECRFFTSSITTLSNNCPCVIGHVIIGHHYHFLVTNPSYMKEYYEQEIITIYRADDGTSENVHQLDEKALKAVQEVVQINLTDPVKEKYYKQDTDPL